MNLENTVKDLMNEFEQMKKNQMNVKKEQDKVNQKMTSIKASILQTSDIRIGDISGDISNIQSAYKNLSSLIDSDRQLQASFNDDILVQQVNISNLINDISKKVAFTAKITKYRFKSSDGQSLIFPTIISNVGNGYNNQDGVFTAPTDGTYVFFCKIAGANNPTDLYFEFILNGSAKTRNLVYSRSSVPYRTASNLIVLQLGLGDRVWIRMNRGGSHYNNGPGGDQSFSGFLL